MQAIPGRRAEMPEINTARLGAQIHVLEFHARLGFVATGPEYLDAGMVHRDASLALRPGSG